MFSVFLGGNWRWVPLGSVLGLNYFSPWRLFDFQTEMNRANLLKLFLFCYLLYLFIALPSGSVCRLIFCIQAVKCTYSGPQLRGSSQPGFPWQRVPLIRVVWIHSCLCCLVPSRSGLLFRGRKAGAKRVMGRLSLGKSLNITNVRDQFLWAGETEHPTQTLVFTKTAGRHNRVEQGRIQGEGAGGAHPPPWNDLRPLSN